MRCFAQRKPVGNLRQNGQIQFVRNQLTPARHLAFCADLGHADIATWPAQAVAGFELKTVGLKLKPARQETAPQAPGCRMKFQWRQLFVQRCADVGQRHVSCGACQFAPCDVCPDTKGAVTLGHLQAGIDIAP